MIDETTIWGAHGLLQPKSTQITAESGSHMKDVPVQLQRLHKSNDDQVHTQ
jgi:hypothetical protein